MNLDKAPLYSDSLALNHWLIDRLSAARGPLATAICEQSLALYRALLLALEGRRRRYHLDQADENLLTLRGLLRLSAEVALLDPRQLMHVLERADAIVRQLGGWRRSLAKPDRGANDGKGAGNQQAQTRIATKPLR